MIGGQQGPCFERFDGQVTSGPSSPARDALGMTLPPLQWRWFRLLRHLSLGIAEMECKHPADGADYSKSCSSVRRPSSKYSAGTRARLRDVEITGPPKITTTRGYSISFPGIPAFMIKGTSIDSMSARHGRRRCRIPTRSLSDHAGGPQRCRFWLLPVCCRHDLKSPRVSNESHFPRLPDSQLPGVPRPARQSGWQWPGQAPGRVCHPSVPAANERMVRTLA